MAPAVVIVGAGWYGLAAAKAYLDLRPDARLTIIDADSSVGGVWSKKRVHAGLTVDSPVTLFEFSDMPMKDVKELNLNDWDELPSDKTHRYLELYAEKHGLSERMRLNTTITSIRQVSGWDLDVEQNSMKETIHCDKLIMATGVYSVPKLPKLDTSLFTGKSFHSKVLGENLPYILKPEVSRVTIVGGCKSAVDAVIVCAKSGKRIDWVIREDDKGKGPAWLFGIRRNDRPVAKIKQLRASMCLSPNIFQKDNMLSRFLFKTTLGIRLINAMTRRVSRKALLPYESQKGRLLKPKAKNVFWNINAGALQDDAEFWKLVNEGDVHIHRTEIESLSGTDVKLKNGESFSSDVVVFATGWQNSGEGLFPYEKQADFGLPILATDETPKAAQNWKQLVQNADERILKRFPILKEAPPRPEPETTPFRLYRQLVPPKLAASGDRSLAFLGVFINTFTSTAAEVSALWVAAYLEDLLPGPAASILSDENAMDRNIAELHAWITRRYGSPTRPRGGMEIQTWIDLLITDLGLNPERRRRGFFGWLRENFTPYVCRDFAGLAEEFKAKNDSKRIDSRSK